jgi:hypothetical protein
MSGVTVGLMKTILNRRAQKNIGEEANSALKNEPESQSRVRDIFQNGKDRLRSTWVLSISMTITLFTLFVGMAIAAVVMGIISGKSMYPIVFGGLSVTSLFTVILWKPYDKAFQATITIQKLEIILVGLEEEWTVCLSIANSDERASCVRSANKSALDEMSKLSSS